MGFSIDEMVQSTGYKVFMKYLYGWGASVVLIGALFKLEHFPGASIMLIIGMTTEAIIFFFSAFEPLVPEYDWTIVYPELAGITDESNALRGGGIDPLVLENAIVSAISRSQLSGGSLAAAPVAATIAAPAVGVGGQQNAGGNAGFVFTQKFNDMLEKANVGPELFAKVGAGLDKLSTATTGIARISEAVAATEQFSRNMQRAGGAVGKFAESYENSGALVSRSAQVLSQSFDGTAKQVDETGKQFAAKVSDVVSKMSTSLTGASDSVAKGIAATGAQLQGLGKNIEALTTAHELQVKEMQKSMQQSQKLGSGVEEMLQKIEQTIKESQQYSQSVSKLNDNVSKLNTIYGNMLSAMGTMSSQR